VKNTVLGGINLGYFVFLLVDAIKGVDVKPGDSDQAIEDMQRAGAVAITLEDMIDLEQQLGCKIYSCFLRGKSSKPLVKKDLTSLSSYVILKRLLEEPKVRGSL
jgi:hypothetical protein